MHALQMPGLEKSSKAQRAKKQQQQSYAIVVLAFDDSGLGEQLQQLLQFADSSGSAATTTITVVATQQTLQLVKLQTWVLSRSLPGWPACLAAWPACLDAPEACCFIEPDPATRLYSLNSEVDRSLAND
jgi:hypothetical protein